MHEDTTGLLCLAPLSLGDGIPVLALVSVQDADVLAWEPHEHVLHCINGLTFAAAGYEALSFCSLETSAILEELGNVCGEYISNGNFPCACILARKLVIG